MTASYIAPVIDNLFRLKQLKLINKFQREKSVIDLIDAKLFNCFIKIYNA